MGSSWRRCRRPVPISSALGSVSTGGPPVTRFAPSPTGYLHLGPRGERHLRLGRGPRRRRARRCCARGSRSACAAGPHYEAALPRGSRLARLRARRGTPAAGATERPAGAASRTRSRSWTAPGRVYACDCSRQRVGGGRYDGRCRDRGLARGRRARPARAARRRAGARATTCCSARSTQRPATQCGDLLVRDRDGHWTYQFAVTVDDTRPGHHAGHSRARSGRLHRPAGGAGAAARPAGGRRSSCTTRSSCEPAGEKAE